MIAELRIETAVRAEKTVLKNCFYTPPFKVLDITEDKTGSALHLMLMNASPGVLDGDQYNIQINAAAGSSMQLHTQSYQRLFHMKKDATQQVHIEMQAGSSFCYVPHPTVPHVGSDFTTKNKIFLAENCTLLWGEVLTCGRKGSGEQFLFSKYHSVTEIFLHSRLVVKENLLLQPTLFDVFAMGQLENYTHQASLIYLNEETSMQKLTDGFYEMLLLEKDICFGVTALPVNGFLVRILGYKGEQLYGLLKKLAAALIATPTRKLKPIIKQKDYAN